MKESTNTSTTTNSGINFIGLLAIVVITLKTIGCIVLKLTGVISWSWVWVFSPLWISVSLGILMVIIAIIITTVIKRLK